jgi:hypothetical protein
VQRERQGGLDASTVVAMTVSAMASMRAANINAMVGARPLPRESISMFKMQNVYIALQIKDICVKLRHQIFQ